MASEKTQAQRVIENTLMFGLPDTLSDNIDLAVLVRAIVAVLSGYSVRSALRDFLDQLDEEERYNDARQRQLAYYRDVPKRLRPEGDEEDREDGER